MTTPQLQLHTTPSTEMTLSSFEQDAYDEVYKQCLKAYEALMELQHPHILITDADDATLPSRNSDADWRQFKRFQAWIKAVSSCGFVADGFLSIQMSKPTSEFASTSANTLALEDAALSLSSQSSSSEESATGEEESDDEESDIDPEELAERCQRRSRRHTVYLTTTTSDTQQIINTPLPAVAPQLPRALSPTEEEDPEAFWNQRTSEWTWDVGIPRIGDIPSFTFTMMLTPPDEETCANHIEAWTPLQFGTKLIVPGYFTIDTLSPHANCLSCCPEDYAEFDARLATYSGACLDELRTMLPEHQRIWGVHAVMWTDEFRACMCAPWREYDSRIQAGETNLPPPEDMEEKRRERAERQQLKRERLEYERQWYEMQRAQMMQDAEVEPHEAITPTFESRIDPPVETVDEAEVDSAATQDCFELAATPASPMETPKSPRWIDIPEDDDELPDLNDWT